MQQLLHDDCHENCVLKEEEKIEKLPNNINIVVKFKFFLPRLDFLSYCLKIRELLFYIKNGDSWKNRSKTSI